MRFRDYRIHIVLACCVCIILLAATVVQLRTQHHNVAFDCSGFDDLRALNIDKFTPVNHKEIRGSRNWIRANSLADYRPKKWKLTADWESDLALIESKDRQFKIKSKYPIVEDELGANFPFLCGEIEGAVLVFDKSGRVVGLHCVCKKLGAKTLYTDDDGLLVNAFLELQSGTLVLAKAAGFIPSKGPKGEYTEVELIIVDLRGKRLFRHRSPGATVVVGVSVRKGGGAIAFGCEGEESYRTLVFNTGVDGDK